MWHKVADGVYCIQDADGLPAALVTALDDGTPLKAAETWWAASRRLLKAQPSSEVRQWLNRHGDQPWTQGDAPV